MHSEHAKSTNEGTEADWISAEGLGGCPLHTTHMGEWDPGIGLGQY